MFLSISFTNINEYRYVYTMAIKYKNYDMIIILLSDNNFKLLLSLDDHYKFVKIVKKKIV